MIKQISIFDLDGTTIDSNHRQATLPKESLDLNIGLKMLSLAKFLLIKFCL